MKGTEKLWQKLQNLKRVCCSFSVSSSFFSVSHHLHLKEWTFREMMIFDCLECYYVYYLHLLLCIYRRSKMFFFLSLLLKRWTWKRKLSFLHHFLSSLQWDTRLKKTKSEEHLSSSLLLFHLMMMIVMKKRWTENDNKEETFVSHITPILMVNIHEHEGEKE